MNFKISQAEELGPLIRATRKASALRQDDAAGLIGVSENFLGKVEKGSESVLWGKLFEVIQGLGLRITVEVPAHLAAQVDQELTRQKQRNVEIQKMPAKPGDQ